MLLFGLSTRTAARQSYLLLISHSVSDNELLRRRSFATTLSLAGKNFRIFRPLAHLKKRNAIIKGATWLTSDPSKVKPADLLDQLTNLEGSRASGLQTAVFLATPSFTHWLDKDNDFLSKAVQQIFSHQADGPSEIRTISAIVDGVPSDEKLRIEDSSVEYEGISILLSTETIRSLQAGSDIAEAARQKSHVRFVAQNGEKDQRLVALPVANTLFHNGHHSTSFQDLWQWSDPHEPRRHVDRTSRVPLHSFDITTSSLLNPHYIGMPMEPLTRPQEISSSMGNVIRELKRSDTGESFPASTELEAAVPQFLSSSWLTDFARKSFTVFALTSRKGCHDYAKAEVRAEIWPPVRSLVLKGLLEGQMQMHRVTGGGGGWGNKKGLLSLEPGDDLFDNRHGQRLLLPQRGEDYNFESTSVVSPGDNVQFFAIFPGPQHAREDQSQEWLVGKRAEEEEEGEEEEAQPEGEKTPKNSFPLIVIGTNPPELQYQSTPNDASQSGGELRFVPNRFGMLSQDGACLGRAGASTSSGGESTIFTSRLDIPYTRIVVKAIPGFHEAEVVGQTIRPNADDSQIP